MGHLPWPYQHTSTVAEISEPQGWHRPHLRLAAKGGRSIVALAAVHGQHVRNAQLLGCEPHAENERLERAEKNNSPWKRKTARNHQFLGSIWIFWACFAEIWHAQCRMVHSYSFRLLSTKIRSSLRLCWRTCWVFPSKWNLKQVRNKVRNRLGESNLVRCHGVTRPLPPPKKAKILFY